MLSVLVQHPSIVIMIMIKPRHHLSVCALLLCPSKYVFMHRTQGTFVEPFSLVLAKPSLTSPTQQAQLVS